VLCGTEFEVEAQLRWACAGLCAAHLAFNRLRYSVQAIPQVDWNGTRYCSGMSLKFTVWIRGHTFQLATIAAARASVSQREQSEQSERARECVRARARAVPAVLLLAGSDHRNSRMYIYRAGQFASNGRLLRRPLRGRHTASRRACSARGLTSENFCPISSELFPSITPIEPTNATSYNPSMRIRVEDIGGLLTPNGAL
jgi:hypothetical protein